MPLSVLSFFVSFLMCLAITPAVIRFASRRKWFDQPDWRKIHSDEIPRLGGVAIMGALLITVLLLAGAETLLASRYFLAGLLMLFFIGLWDDLQPMRPVYKLVGEFIPVLLLSYSARIPVCSVFPELQGMEMLEWPLTMVIVFWSVNAFNLIDGINGLAGTIGFLSLLGMSLWGGEQVINLALPMAGAILAFLFFNFIRPQIFMGDCGSLPIGYMVAFGLTQLFPAGQLSESSKMLCFASIGLLALPLFDMVRVFFIRIAKRKNPFKGDRNHLHHLLLELGFSHAWATLLLASLSLITACIAGFSSSFFTRFDLAFWPVMAITTASLLVFTAVVWLRVRKVRVVCNTINGSL